MKYRILAVATLLFGATLVGCKKYEDNPDEITLTPRSERMVNTWIFAYAEEDGQNVTDSFDQYELYMNASNEAELKAEYTTFGIDYSTTTEGTWAFTNDEANVLFNFNDDDFDEEYQILRLTKDELWILDVDDDLEIHLLPK
jgi:hypothetical protein